MTVKLEWKGDSIASKLKEQVAREMNVAVAQAVQGAQQDAPRDTGFMASTIEVIDEATAKKLIARWGNQTAKYTLWQEIGARGMPGKYFLRRNGERAYNEFVKRVKALG